MNALPDALQMAAAVVDGLARAGLTAVHIAPGSRSTPLTLAFYAHPTVKVYRHLDERSAGFFALGMALAGDRPTALVCTSGTAAANLMPAVVEARMSQVPLLLLTADRPHELRHSGANQTIDQVKFFGDQVLWAVDMPLPHGDDPNVAVRAVRSTAVRAYATADGLPKGPVHLNFPFRKPLEPQGEAAAGWLEALAARFSAGDEQSRRISRGVIHPAPEQLDELVELLRAHPRGMIVCGPRSPGGPFPEQLTALAQRLGYPVAADPLSGVRYAPVSAEATLLSSYETSLTQPPPWEEPQLVLRFGAVPLSKWLNQYLDRIHPRERIHIRENGVWADDSQRISWFLQANESIVLDQLLAVLPPAPSSSWLNKVRRWEEAATAALIRAQVNRYYEGGIAADLLTLLPEGAHLVLGNSLPVRHLDQFGLARQKRIHTYANRGASGIDGNVSTALGIAAAVSGPVVLLIGDITLYHDLNGLLAARDHPNLSIVLLNNDGGGIFNRLPVSAIDPPFRDLFTTPHGLSFAPAAAMYGLQYATIHSRTDFARHLTAALADGNTPHLIEVRFDGAVDERRRREIVAEVQRALREAFG